MKNDRLTWNVLIHVTRFHKLCYLSVYYLYVNIQMMKLDRNPFRSFSLKKLCREIASSIFNLCIFQFMFQFYLDGTSQA